MKLKLPDSYVLIFCLIVLCGVASYFVPSGTYERQTDSVTGIIQVIPGSYHVIKQTSVSIFQIFKAIPEGMVEVADIIIFILIAGGSFGIIQATGVVNSLMSTIAKKYFGKEKFVIPIIMIIFSFAGAIVGTSEELLPLIPIFITLSIAMGFDEITGVAMVLLGAISGYTAGFLNPFTTGIAQKLCGLPLFSGIAYRVICYVAFLTTAIIFVCHYAGQIKKGIIKPEKIENEYSLYPSFELNELPQIERRHVAIGAVILISISFMVYGVLARNFNITDIATVFLVMGIVSGMVGKFKSGRIVMEFINGASSLLYGALIVGLARGILIIMKYGHTIDTVIYQISQIISVFSPTLSAISMFIAHTLISLFITSSTGEASATMPIMVALADFSGFTRQTAVLAYQFGDGFTNVFSPLCGYFMAALAMSGLSWKKWIKWIWPLMVVWYILGFILIAISVIIGYGPF